MKKSEEAVIRDQLRRMADRLRNENEALLKLVREVNAQGSPASGTPGKSKKSPKTINIP